METFNEEQIHRILSSYKNKREKDKERYQKKKDDPEFVEKNRTRAREHYHKNKDVKRERYYENRDVAIARNSFYYYRKLNNLDLFQDKFPERYKLIESLGYSLSDQNPSSSTSTSSSV